MKHWNKLLSPGCLVYIIYQWHIVSPNSINTTLLKAAIGATALSYTALDNQNSMSLYSMPHSLNITPQWGLPSGWAANQTCRILAVCEEFLSKYKLVIFIPGVICLVLVESNLHVLWCKLPWLIWDGRKAQGGRVDYLATANSDILCLKYKAGDFQWKDLRLLGYNYKVMYAVPHLIQSAW